MTKILDQIDLIAQDAGLPEVVRVQIKLAAVRIAREEKR